MFFRHLQLRDFGYLQAAEARRIFDPALPIVARPGGRGRFLRPAAVFVERVQLGAT